LKLAHHIKTDWSQNQIEGELNLNDGNIGDKGCLFVADALKSCHSITELWLKDNNIGKEGC